MGGVSVENEPLVSAIIPFYNLEDCVSYCLSSVVNQTYQKLEIICIDDGSKDSTKAAIHKFTTKDKRIRLIRQNNSGQASARNHGLNVATGEYVAFIDGDDYVAPQYIQRLVEGVSAHENCMAITGFVDVSIQSPNETIVPNKIEQKTVWRTATIDDLLYRDLVSCCWGRMAPVSLFRAHPLGQRFYEDVAIEAEYISSAKTLLYLDEPLYYHVRRKGSTVNAKAVPIQQIRDYMSALAKQSYELQLIGASWDAIAFMRALHLTRIFRIALRSDKSDKFVSETKKACLDEIKRNLATILRDNHISKANKTRFVVITHAPGMYECIFNKFVQIRQKHITHSLQDESRTAE